MPSAFALFSFPLLFGDVPCMAVLLEIRNASKRYGEQVLLDEASKMRALMKAQGAGVEGEEG